MKKMNLIGVDVSDASIKVLQLDQDYNILAYGSGALPEGAVVDSLIEDKNSFTETLKQLLTNTQPHILSQDEQMLRAVVCLPDSKLFTHFFELPDTVHKSDMKQCVEDEAQKIIPFPLNDLYFDYHVGEHNGKKMVTFVGAPKKNVDSYVDAFTHAGVRPALIGGELFSLGKTLLPEPIKEEAYMIVDIGAHTSNIGVFTIDSIANMSITVPIGGEKITSAIAQKLEISNDKAELLKVKQGIDSKNKKNKVPEIVIECIQEIVSTIKNTCVYFETKNNTTVKHIIVAGGSGLLVGLSEFLTEATGIETSIANPLTKIKNPEVLGKETPSVLFASVIGLAIQSMDLRKSGINLLTQYRYSDDATVKAIPSILDVRSKSDFYYVVYFYFDVIRDAFLSLSKFTPTKLNINFRLVVTLFFLLLAFAFLGWVVISYM